MTASRSASVAAFLIAFASGAAAQNNPDWTKPHEPFRVMGPIYYVGTKGLAVYLIATPAGHVLVDGALPESAPLIEASIRALGFDPKDLRVLLTTQAHFDHVGTMAHLQRLSGARALAMQGDEGLLESGGATDHLFGGAPRFDKVKVSRVLKDQDTVVLGGVTLVARRTPGHTPGSTTWLTTVEDGGRRYEVVFPASTAINDGTRLLDRPSYPGIADDFAHAFAVLESLKPEVFLASHAELFKLEEKRARQKAGAPGDPNPFVDPEGFRASVAMRKKAFEEQLAKERAALAEKR
jgi:metallo-beta-lactamase class B